jgi:hypothetical protein
LRGIWSSQGRLPEAWGRRVSFFFYFNFFVLLLPQRHLPWGFKLEAAAAGERPAVGRKMLVEPFELINMIDDLCFLQDCDILYSLQGSNSSPFYSCSIGN